MATSEEINTRFTKAYKMACNTKLEFAPDILLQFYSYYKKATQKNGFYLPTTNTGDLRGAFKVNALVQVKNLSKEEAKLKYISLVEEHIGKVEYS